jgi:hypothetical protein
VLGPLELQEDAVGRGSPGSGAALAESVERSGEEDAGERGDLADNLSP